MTRHPPSSILKRVADRSLDKFRIKEFNAAETAYGTAPCPYLDRSGGRPDVGRHVVRNSHDRALDRIDAAQSTLNAFKIVRRQKALEEAADADRRLARGEQLPLLGVPIAVKDDVDITGEPTAFGCPGDFPVKTEDSEMVRRLRAAGAVIVGKTNSPELGQWPLTSGSAFGYTRNPWSREHTPGGSSGGTSAAVAAGLVSAGIGSDGAGSIRIPAAWTNLVGIKPQRGRISTWPRPEAFYGLTVNGPLARTVADAALLLDVAAGNHDGDLHTPTPLTVSDAVGSDPGRLNIALSLRNPFTATPVTLDPEVRRAVYAVADTLRSLGHRVVVDDPAYGLIFGLNFLPTLTRRGTRLARAPPRPGARRPENSRKCTERQATSRGTVACRSGSPTGMPAHRRDLRQVRRCPCTNHGNSADPGHRYRRYRRLGNRQGDDCGVPVCLAMECPRVALDQYPRGIQQRRTADRSTIDG